MDDVQRAIETLKDIHNVVEVRIKNGDNRVAVYIPPDELMDLRTAISVMLEWQQYRQIGTLEECQKARRKQGALKPVNNRGFYCPHCGGLFRYSRDTYCSQCGQAIDWRTE